MSANYVIIQGFFYFSFISTSLFFPWKKQISIYQQNLVQALFYFYFFPISIQGNHFDENLAIISWVRCQKKSISFELLDFCVLKIALIFL